MIEFLSAIELSTLTDIPRLYTSIPAVFRKGHRAEVVQLSIKTLNRPGTPPE